MANSRNYSNSAVSTTLNGAITNVGTSVILSSQTGMPSTPFLLSLEPDTANEEIVLATSGAGTGGSPYVVTRGQDGTAAIAHSTLVTVQHRVAAVDFTDSRTHEAATGGIHGLNGSSISVNGGMAGLTSTLTIASTASETTCAKSFTIPGNSLAAGSMYRVVSIGTIACTATPTIAFKLKYGSTVMATISAITMGSGVTTVFRLEGLFTALSVGGTGTLNGSISLVAPNIDTAAITQGNLNTKYLPMNSTQQTSISTTGNQALTMTAQFSASSPSNVVTVYNTLLEQLF